MLQIALALFGIYILISKKVLISKNKAIVGKQTTVLGSILVVNALVPFFIEVDLLGMLLVFVPSVLAIIYFVLWGSRVDTSELPQYEDKLEQYALTKTRGNNKTALIILILLVVILLVMGGWVWWGRIML